MTFEERGEKVLQEFVKAVVERRDLEDCEKGLRELGEALCFLASERGWCRNTDPLLALIAGWREGERHI